MDITAGLGVAASVAGVLSWYHSVAVKKADKIVDLMKIEVGEEIEVELRTAIEWTLSVQIIQQVTELTAQMSEGRLDQNARGRVVDGVCTWFASEHTPEMENEVWVFVEPPLETRVENSVKLQCHRAGLRILNQETQRTLKGKIKEQILSERKPAIESRVHAVLGRTIREWGAERLRAEVATALHLSTADIASIKVSDTDPPGVTEFSHNEDGYRDWVQSHPQGFVVNTPQPSTDQSRYMILHRARCRFVTNFDRYRPGAFTGNDLMKVCADEIAPLRQWAEKHGRPDGQFTGECMSCRPSEVTSGVKATPPADAPPTPHRENSPLPSTSAPQDEQALLLAKCRTLPPAQGHYLINDYIENLLLTVVDFQLKTNVVEKAQSHYLQFEKDNIRTHRDLKTLLASQPDTQEGNTQIAQKLWGYNLWTRVQLLRRLIAYFERVNVTDQEQLTTWAETTRFEDFAGQVKGVGYAIFQWLVMRQGVETIKPDVHVLRFVQEAVGHPVTGTFAVTALERVAQEMGVKAYELDWRIWEYEMSKPTGATVNAPSA